MPAKEEGAKNPLGWQGGSLVSKGVCSAQRQEPLRQTGWKEEAAASAGCSVRRQQLPGPQASPEAATEPQSSAFVSGALQALLPWLLGPIRSFTLDRVSKWGPRWLGEPRPEYSEVQTKQLSGRRPYGPPVQDLGVGVGVIQGHTASS